MRNFAIITQTLKNLLHQPPPLLIKAPIGAKGGGTFQS
jgi:hypothetical protein